MLEAELAKCRTEISSLEKELSDSLKNNLLEISSRSSGKYIINYILILFNIPVHIFIDQRTTYYIAIQIFE